MKVVGVDEFGGPEALRVFELPERHAGPGEVRIRVHAAAVNPTDTYVRNGARAEQQKASPRPTSRAWTWPGCSTRSARASRPTWPWATGSWRSSCPRGRTAATASSLVLPAESVAAAPAGSNHAEASTLPMNGLTARLALDLLALQPGDTLAVTGAAGAFGGYMVQLGKADGLTVIADASPADEQLVRDLGADVVVPRGDDVAARIREVVPGGVDALADGAVQHTLVLPAVRDGGAVAAVRGFAGETERDITIHPVWVREYLKAQAALDRLRQQAADGVVTLRVARTFPADQASEAHRLLEAGGTRGRFVLEF